MTSILYDIYDCMYDIFRWSERNINCIVDVKKSISGRYCDRNSFPLYVENEGG